MALTVGDIHWRYDNLNSELADLVDDVRGQLGARYAADVDALRLYLVQYFNSYRHCSEKQGDSINPIGASESGLKRLKVRWTYPGSGKSGGLRLGFLLDCDERRVMLGYGRRRRDTSDSALRAALDEADARFSE
ncbi:MAG: hypothetical protein JKY65_16785 [Planctomycetes bacterium]|nr:hypothetical protein [Planctomycetota bacterium]